MRRGIWNVRWLALALALLLVPGVAGAQINRYPSSGDRVLLCHADNLSLTTSGTSEQALATCSIPPGALTGAYAGFHLEFTAVGAANANSKTVSAHVGGIAGASVAARIINVSGDTTFASVTCHLRDTTNLLICQGIQSVSGGTTSGNIYGGPFTSGANFSAQVDIVFSMTTGTLAGDATLKSYRVELLRRKPETP